MTTDGQKVVDAPPKRRDVLKFDGVFQNAQLRRAAVISSPPSCLVDELAREEWERVSTTLVSEGSLSLAHRSLVVGYCNAVARAIRAEQTLAVEGRYYETKTRRGSVMRRRHPAAKDAEEGWTTARQFAKQLGITGGQMGEQHAPNSRRSVFK